jgi:hypothetical protein
MRWRLLALGRHQELTGRLPGQVTDLQNRSGPDLKVVNFEQTRPRGCHRFGATPLAEGTVPIAKSDQAQRIRALCRALFDNGDHREGSGLSRYSTRNGGRVAKTRGYSSTLSKTRTNANAVAITSRPLVKVQSRKFRKSKCNDNSAKDDSVCCFAHGSSSLARREL